MILDSIDDTDQNTKRIHSRAQRGGKNGVPLPGEPRRRQKKEKRSRRLLSEISFFVVCSLESFFL